MSGPAGGFITHGRSPLSVPAPTECLHSGLACLSNVVMSRSMNHKGVEFLILARPGREQWTVMISYPRSTNPTAVRFEGSRDKAIAVARDRIDGWLKKGRT
jgi:hypothetical protein